MGKKASETTVQSRRDSEIIVWTEQMDEVLIDALEAQHDYGNRVGVIFTSTAYKNVVNELREKLGKDFSKQHIKNRMKTIKKNFNECYDIFKNGLSGFGFNSLSKMWEAKPEDWNALIEANPAANKWKNTPMKNYEKLTKLFGKDRAKSDLAENAKEKIGRWASSSSKNNLETIYDIDEMLAKNEKILKGFDCMIDDTSHPTTLLEGTSCPTMPVEGTSTTTPHLNTSSRKRKLSSEGNFGLELKQAVVHLALALREGNSVLERSRARVYSEKEVYNELINIGVDQHLRMSAYRFLIGEPQRVRAFFGCPAEERKEFLFLEMKDAGKI